MLKFRERGSDAINYFKWFTGVEFSIYGWHWTCVYITMHHHQHHHRHHHHDKMNNTAYLLQAMLKPMTPVT